MSIYFGAEIALLLGGLTCFCASSKRRTTTSHAVVLQICFDVDLICSENSVKPAARSTASTVHRSVSEPIFGGKSIYKKRAVTYLERRNSQTVSYLGLQHSVRRMHQSISHGYQESKATQVSTSRPPSRSESGQQYLAGSQ